MQSLSLFELNEHIRRALALNFPEAIWVRAEVAQVNESRGHYYFSLVEKDESGNGILAKADAALWNSQFRVLRKKHGKKLLEELLQDHLDLLLKVSIDFHEQYGLKLMVEDIDPTYTYGKLAMQRQEVLKKLKKKKLFEKNGKLPLPDVLQNIAILSNERAAGYHDFVNQLQSNQYGYSFELTLFPIALQGEKVKDELTEQAKQIGDLRKQFDCVVLIRGGGSKLDLAAFDNYEVVETLAKMKLPVLTGIGHEIDESIADMVAHKALKTPTAVAEFLIQKNTSFEESLLMCWHQISHVAQQTMHTSKIELESIAQNIKLLSKETLKSHHQLIDYIAQEVPAAAKNKLQKEALQVENLATLCHSLSPERVLERGYSITKKDGKIIARKSELKEGDQIETVLKKGTVKSKIVK